MSETNKGDHRTVARVEIEALLSGSHSEPHRVLGAHPERQGGQSGAAVRAYHPEAEAAYCILEDGRALAMSRVDERGLFAVFVAAAELPLRYRLRLDFRGGGRSERVDPYSFLPSIGEQDLYYFGEGSHRRLWEVLGAHHRVIDGVTGVSFAVWAPNARSVSLVGDFCNWDGRIFPMRCLGGSGVYEIFVPELPPGALYKYEINTHEEGRVLKSDPFAQATELPPATASRVFESCYRWEDDAWMDARPGRKLAEEPVSVYEVHLASWARAGDHGQWPLDYREIAVRLVEHVKRFAFTHIELLPITEHPFGGSWGYQTTGYFAPTARHGDPDGLRFLVDLCHRNGIGVILDWVPAHFPKDAFALRRFDGTPLYEHEDPRLGEHPDWGTMIFNYSRNEVRNFLVAGALFWLLEYHFDGLRVDAVASMLYRDYSRNEGEWLPNAYGGREHLEAVDFLRETNEAIRNDCPGCFAVAEESTSWPGVTRPVSEGGLGFAFKWNMGWMHDTLSFFSRDPIYRGYHHSELTFAMLYEYSERFLMPLSHDEVVHGKRSLLEKMPGDLWQKFANLRLLLSYQFTRPGKKLLFMGTELAPQREWDDAAGLDWRLAGDPPRAGLAAFLEDLGGLYRRCAPLWRLDHDPAGAAWLDFGDVSNSIISYLRSDGSSHVIVVLNFTPGVHEDYRIGCPHGGAYRQLLNSDDRRYGGSEFDSAAEPHAEPHPYHGQSHSLRLRVPPLGALVLEPVY